MHYFTIKSNDVANGPGIRTSLFVSGCRHACPDCFNRAAWNFRAGEPFTEDTIKHIVTLVGRPFIKGLTLLGGEPLDPKNQSEVLKLLQACKAAYPDKTIWCYTGYTYDHITHDMIPNLPYTKEILSLIDVLVEGQFIVALKDLKLQFRGSANQRVIDLRATEKAQKIVWALDANEEAKYIHYPQIMPNTFPIKVTHEQNTPSYINMPTTVSINNIKTQLTHIKQKQD
ncbi:MAG: anaerobic ribonucleoside-triphosphate reductase activating protein [Alcaligenaceae bacterium]|nr:anaerobic ribonucleoside-triphosphate reductase activating protein [Alcaligenaceae bacterium]